MLSWFQLLAVALVKARSCGFVPCLRQDSYLLVDPISGIGFALTFICELLLDDEERRRGPVDLACRLGFPSRFLLRFLKLLTVDMAK